MLIGDWLGYLDVLDIGTDDGNALWFWDGKQLGTTLRALDGLSLGKYDETVLKSLEGSTEIIAEVNL